MTQPENSFKVITIFLELSRVSKRCWNNYNSKSYRCRPSKTDLELKQRAVKEQQTECDKVVFPQGAVWNSRLLESGKQCSAQTSQIKDKSIQY